MFDFLNISMLNYYEGDEPESDPEVPEPEVPPPAKAPEKTFSQDDVNKFLAEERRKLQKSNERSIKQLEELKKTAALTSEEKEKLETRIEDLKNDFLTKEEIRQKELKKDKDKDKKEKEELSKDRDRWKTLYSDSTIERNLLDAAVERKAFNPTQIVKHLKPDTRLVEELDEENRPTGRLIPKIKFAGKDKDGNSVLLDLTATEAVKQMSEMPEQFGNFFLSGATGGLGSHSVSSHSSNEVPTDPGEYRKWRDKNSYKVGHR